MLVFRPHERDDEREGEANGEFVVLHFVSVGAAGEKCVGVDCGVFLHDEVDVEDVANFVLHAARRRHSEQHFCACDLNDSDCGGGACVAIHRGHYFVPVCGDRHGVDGSEESAEAS